MSAEHPLASGPDPRVGGGGDGGDGGNGGGGGGGGGGVDVDVGPDPSPDPPQEGSQPPGGGPETIQDPEPAPDPGDVDTGPGDPDPPQEGSQPPGGGPETIEDPEPAPEPPDPPQEGSQPPGGGPETIEDPEPAPEPEDPPQEGSQPPGAGPETIENPIITTPPGRGQDDRSQPPGAGPETIVDPEPVPEDDPQPPGGGPETIPPPALDDGEDGRSQPPGGGPETIDPADSSPYAPENDPRRDPANWDRISQDEADRREQLQDTQGTRTGQGIEDRPGEFPDWLQDQAAAFEDQLVESGEVDSRADIGIFYDEETGQFFAARSELGERQARNRRRRRVRQDVEEDLERQLGFDVVPGAHFTVTERADGSLITTTTPALQQRVAEQRASQQAAVREQTPANIRGAPQTAAGRLDQQLDEQAGVDLIPGEDYEVEREQQNGRTVLIPTITTAGQRKIQRGPLEPGETLSRPRDPGDRSLYPGVDETETIGAAGPMGVTVPEGALGDGGEPVTGLFQYQEPSEEGQAARAVPEGAPGAGVPTNPDRDPNFDEFIGGLEEAARDAGRQLTSRPTGPAGPRTVPEGAPGVGVATDAGTQEDFDRFISGFEQFGREVARGVSRDPGGPPGAGVATDAGTQEDFDRLVSGVSQFGRQLTSRPTGPAGPRTVPEGAPGVGVATDAGTQEDFDRFVEDVGRGAVAVGGAFVAGRALVASGDREQIGEAITSAGQRVSAPIESEIRSETETYVVEEETQPAAESLLGSGGFLTEEQEAAVRERARARQEQYGLGEEAETAARQLTGSETAAQFAGGVGSFPGQLAAAPALAQTVGESAVEAGENLPRTLDRYGGAAVAGAATAGAAGLGLGLITTAQRNPARFAGQLAPEIALGAVGGRALGMAVRTRPVSAIRGRVRTAGSREVDASDLTPGDTIRKVETGEGPSSARFPGADDPGLYQRAPAEAVRRQAEDYTPEEVDAAFREAGADEGVVLKKALADEPEGGGPGGYQAPAAETPEGQAYESPGSFVSPSLSPYFFRVREQSAGFSLRPGLPDLGGGRPTGVLVRTDVDEPDARTLQDFNEELLERAGETTARTKPAGTGSPGEIEALLPPEARYADIGGGRRRQILRRLGVGSDFYTRVRGERVPIRLVRPEGETRAGRAGAAAGEVADQAEETIVNPAFTGRRLSEISRSFEQPVDRPLPSALGASQPSVEAETSATQAEATSAESATLRESFQSAEASGLRSSFQQGATATTSAAAESASDATSQPLASSSATATGTTSQSAATTESSFQSPVSQPSSPASPMMPSTPSSAAAPSRPSSFPMFPSQPSSGFPVVPTDGYTPPSTPGRPRREDEFGMSLDLGPGIDSRREPRENVLTHDWVRETFVTIATEGRLGAFDQAPSQAQLRGARARSGPLAQFFLPTRTELEGTDEEQERVEAVTDFFTSPNIGGGGLDFNW